MPPPGAQNCSSDDTFRKFSPPLSKGNTDLIPNLRGAMGPPVIIAVESRCQGIPFDEWLLGEEFVNSIPDRFIGRR